MMTRPDDITDPNTGTMPAVGHFAEAVVEMVARNRIRRIALSGAADHHALARMYRDGARHKLRMGFVTEHRWLMQDARKEWAKAKRYYREAREHA